MAKEYSRKFYNSKEWRRTSKAYAQSKNGVCERCIKEGIVKPYVIVHHKKHITQKNIGNNEITLSWDNLEALCMDCHNMEHGIKDNKYKFENGMIAPIP